VSTAVPESVDAAMHADGLPLVDELVDAGVATPDVLATPGVDVPDPELDVVAWCAPLSTRSPPADASGFSLPLAASDDVPQAHSTTAPSRPTGANVDPFFRTIGRRPPSTYSVRTTPGPSPGTRFVLGGGEMVCRWISGAVLPAALGCRGADRPAWSG